MSAKGYLPHNVIKGFVFWILTLCLVAATALGILHRWGVMGEEVADRCMWTAFILALGSLAFLVVNYLFGDLGHRLFGPEDSAASVDPAFSERLLKAKVGGLTKEHPRGTDGTDS